MFRTECIISTDYGAVSFLFKNIPERQCSKYKLTYRGVGVTIVYVEKQ